VAGGATRGSAAGRLMAGHANPLGGQQDVGCLAAAVGSVAMLAIQLGMAGMIEVRRREPAIRWGDRGNLVGFTDDMAVGASGEMSPAFAGKARGARASISGVEDQTFQGFAGTEHRPEAGELGLGEVIHLVPGVEAFPAGQFRVGQRQGAHGGPCGGDVPVRHGQFGMRGIQLEPMADLAMLGELHAGHGGTGGIRHVAIRAGEGSALDPHGLAQMDRVIEPESGGIGGLLSEHAELGVSLPELREKVGATALRSGCRVGSDPGWGRGIELGRGKAVTLDGSGGHDRGLVMAIGAAFIGRRGELGTAMFLVAGRAARLVRHARLMPLMVWVTGGAVQVDAGHGMRPTDDGSELLKVPGGGFRAQS